MFLFLFLFSGTLLFSQVDSSAIFLASGDHDTVKLNKLYKFSRRNRYKESELSMRVSRQAIELAKDHPAKRARFWLMLGDVYWHLGKLDSSMAAYDTARVICERINDKSGISMGFKNAGYIYMEKGNYRKALDYYIKSKNLEQEIKNYPGLVISNNYVGEIYMLLRDYKRARMTYQEVIPHFVNTRDFDNLLLMYNNIGAVYIEENKQDSALLWFDKAYRLKDMVLEKNRAITAANIGSALYYQKKYKEAERYLKEAELLFIRTGNEIHLADNYYTMSMLYTDVKKFDQALDYAEKSLAGAKEMNSPIKLQSIYESLTKIYKAKGDYKTALFYHEQYMAYTDSLFNKEKVNIERDLAERYDSENKEYRIGLLSAENKLKDAQAENSDKQRNYLLIILGISLVLAVVLFFFFRNKSRIAGELSSKNEIIQNALEEKEVLLKEIHHRVKNNLQIISSLLNLQHGLAGEKNAEEILKICESRIHSMAIIHEKLYQSENFKEIDFEEYLVDFMEHITQSLLLREKNISTFIGCKNIKLDIDRLVPCSLVLNELIINSVKHGLNGTQNGEIRIECKQMDKTIRIRVSDNGRGLPQDFSFDKYKSLGMRLVYGLVKQIKGEIKNIPETAGACFEISFNLA